MELNDDNANSHQFKKISANLLTSASKSAIIFLRV